MKLLLTGATGFVGRNLLLELLRLNLYETIYLPIRSEQKLNEQLKGEGISEVPACVKPLLMEAPDWDFQTLSNVEHVVHGAGVLFGSSLEDYSRTNTEGTLKLMRTLKGPSKFVILSSQAASGPCSKYQEYKKESDPESPVTWYGASKLDMEKRLETEFGDKDFICLRPPMILGARDSATLPLFRMAKGFIQFKPGFNEKKYSFIDVQDLVRAILAVLQSPIALRNLDSRKLFVASDRVITDTELIKTAVQVLNKSDKIVKIPQPVIWGVSQVVGNIPALSRAVPNLSKDRAKEIWPDRWVVSPKKFEETFQWKAQVGLDRSLKETCDWYIKSGQLSL